jgi:hypothetical protein
MNAETILALAASFEKLAKKPKSWKKKPRGWKQKSVKQYSKTMMSGKKHPFDACVKKMKGKVDSPEGFCASVKDQYKGDTSWRSKEQKKNKKGKKKSQLWVDLEKLAVELGEQPIQHVPVLEHWSVDSDRRIKAMNPRKPGKVIQTSPVVSMDRDIVTTMSGSKYRLGTPSGAWLGHRASIGDPVDMDDPFGLKQEEIGQEEVGQEGMDPERESNRGELG